MSKTSGCYPPTIICLCPFTGSPSVHSAGGAPYLLLEDLPYNDTHSVDGPPTDPHSPAESHSLTSDTDPQLEKLTVTDTHTAIVLQLQQVPAVQAANTERYGATAVAHIQCMKGTVMLLDVLLYTLMSPSGLQITS